MTDLEKLQEALNQMSVGHNLESFTLQDGNPTLQLCIEEGMKNVGGYPGFNCCFYFTLQGEFKLLELGE